ncbi:MAG: hypothetical protein C0625_15645 [Arcobacter sp.]|nr:MAG: hypothetical protein C0625_15645 [Arcobacter sp.]
MSYLYILFSIVFTVYGQYIIKFKIVKYGELPDSIVEKIIFLGKLFLDPYILSGFVSAFIASFFWMAAMTKFDLSHAYPLVMAGLVLLTSIMAIVIFKEPITMFKSIGILLIICGVYFIIKV